MSDGWSLYFSLWGESQGAKDLKMIDKGFKNSMANDDDNNNGNYSGSGQLIRQPYQNQKALNVQSDHAQR